MNTADWKNATPEQHVLFKAVKALAWWGANAVTITPLCFIGDIAGSEFLTYAASKLYVMLKGHFSITTGAGAAASIVDLYNENNTLVFRHGSNYPVYDGALKFYPKRMDINTVYFSKIAQTNFNHMIFVGYRLNK